MELKTNTPIKKEVVLIGGGHSHAIALRMFSMAPLPGVQLTLISDVSHAPYSGMIPGLIAGKYSYDEAHIDLRKLCSNVGARFIKAKAKGLDLRNKKVILENRPEISYDILSINTGSTPDPLNVPGVLENAIPVKPIQNFLDSWSEILKKKEENPTITIVGGGAAGIEVAIAMKGQLRKSKIHLIDKNKNLAATHNRSARISLKKAVKKNGIEIHLNKLVKEVRKDAVICDVEIKTDYTIWVTGSSAPSWPSKSGLAVDNKNFIQVDNALQSTSHPGVLASGDVASMVNYKLEKSGVYAVRQGKIIFENLKRLVENKDLINYKPQGNFLSIIRTGTDTAVASKGHVSLSSSLMWSLKDYIDRGFIGKLSLFKAKSMQESLSDPDDLSESTRCVGCGGKVGSSIVESALRRVRKQESVEVSNLVVGLEEPDDAAVFLPPKDHYVVQSIDYFRALVSDPFLLGQVAARHSINDLLAMGAKPASALALLNIPYAKRSITEELVYQILSGATKVLNEYGAKIIGGHTAEGTTLGVGFSCNGYIKEENILRNNNLHSGDVLILSKALGTGTLFAAKMRGKAKGRDIDAANASMLLSNKAAQEIFLKHQTNACTDITGFGLAGHMSEMLRGTECSFKLELEKLPVINGAMDSLSLGIVSSIHGENVKSVEECLVGKMSDAKYNLLFDPQTSGPLLATVPREKAESCLRGLKEAGYEDAAVIGEVVEGERKIEIV